MYVRLHGYRMQELRDSSLEFLIEKFLIKGILNLYIQKLHRFKKYFKIEFIYLYSFNDTKKFLTLQNPVRLSFSRKDTSSFAFLFSCSSR